MLFHTWVFLAFFLVFYPVYLMVKATPLKLPWLLAASYVFYGWWNPVYLLLIVWSTGVDYLAVTAMARTPWKKPWLALSILNNLGLLGFFKYGGFVVENLNALAERFDLPTAFGRSNVCFLSNGLNEALAWLGTSYRVADFAYLLPVGISFTMFQSMSYSIDYYREQVQLERSFVRYATFVSLFPQLVAGPIERASHLLPQLYGTPRITREDATNGLSLFVVGLFKKVAMADYLAMYVDPVYAAAPEPRGRPAAGDVRLRLTNLTSISAATRTWPAASRDGFPPDAEFREPYLATGLGDFWRRLARQLSTWFRDYVYIPPGGNRHGHVRTHVNMVLTMLISGLWHGAMWTFRALGARPSTRRRPRADPRTGSGPRSAATGCRLSPSRR